MEGGDAPPVEGGLFDENARNQQEMFLISVLVLAERLHLSLISAMLKVEIS